MKDGYHNTWDYWRQKNLKGDNPKKNIKGEPLVIGCNYHTTWQSSPSMRFLLLDIYADKGKALLGTRNTNKTFPTGLDELVFINTKVNLEKASDLGVFIGKYRFRRDIISGETCPYCLNKSEHIDTSVLYGESYGMMYWCLECDAYVGTHDHNPKKALGRLANRELREAKKKAHFYFDQLWNRAIEEQGRSKKEARTSAYKWLSNQLNIPLKYTHIGMFDLELCEQTINICKPYCKKN